MLHRFVIILASLSLILFSGFLSAQTGPVVVTPVGAGGGSLSGSGIVYPITYSAAGGGAANAGFYGRGASFSTGQLGGAARGLLRAGAAGVAILGALYAIGYFIDEVTNDIYKPASAGVPALQGRYYSVGNQCYTLTVSETLSCYSGLLFPGEWGAYRFNHGVYSGGNANAFLYDLYHNPSNQWFNNTVEVSVYGTPLVWPEGSPDPAGSPESPASDAELGEMIKADPATWPEIIATPAGDVIPWAPVVANYSNVAAQYATDNALSVDPYVEPEPSEEEVPQPGQSGAPWPSFCAWASVVCNLADYLKREPDDPPDLPLPEVMLEPVTWSSGLGGGSCPPPRSISLSFGSFDMSWQPVCDLALGIKAFLLISASLMAAYILAGASSRA